MTMRRPTWPCGRWIWISFRTTTRKSCSRKPTRPTSCPGCWSVILPSRGPTVPRFAVRWTTLQSAPWLTRPRAAISCAGSATAIPQFGCWWPAATGYKTRRPHSSCGNACGTWNRPSTFPHAIGTHLIRRCHRSQTRLQRRSQLHARHAIRNLDVHGAQQRAIPTILQMHFLLTFPECDHLGQVVSRHLKRWHRVVEEVQDVLLGGDVGIGDHRGSSARRPAGPAGSPDPYPPGSGPVVCRHGPLLRRSLPARLDRKLPWSLCNKVVIHLTNSMLVVSFRSAGAFSCDLIIEIDEAAVEGSIHAGRPAQTAPVQV
jgi:hypothetical protein